MKADTIPLGYYVDSEIHNQYLLNKKTFKITFDTTREHELMEMSIKEAQKSVFEDDRVHPKVGAVLCDVSGKVLLTAFRGSRNPGDHCEYSLLKKAEEEKIELSETVLFVTLEPCTKRSEGKIPCAQRIVNAGIPMVYIGTLDPNIDICGKGELYLRDRIHVERYPHLYVEEIRELNKNFERMHR
jgi:pyrimidine deaminase RibD-like protein